jgi:alpha-tubulin suppressor-like RCC1 family protein
VTGLSGVEQLALGRIHACALHGDAGAVSCWGTWAGGAQNDTPIAVTGIGGPVRSIGAGDTLTVLGMKDGTVRLFGDNRFSQLGIGSQDAGASTSVPITVAGVAGVTSVANGNSFVPAALADGGTVVWGESGGYQLGLNQTNAVPSPTISPAVAGLRSVSLGDQFGCGIDPSDDVVCWGFNGEKQLGAGGFVLANSPNPVKAGVSNAVVVVAGWGHACAIDKTGAVWCWGFNDDGQIGNGNTTNVQSPFKLGL